MNSSRMGYTTYLSGMLVTVSAIVCPCPKRTTVTLHSQKDFARFPKIGL